MGGIQSLFVSQKWSKGPRLMESAVITPAKYKKYILSQLIEVRCKIQDAKVRLVKVRNPGTTVLHFTPCIVRRV